MMAILSLFPWDSPIGKSPDFTLNFVGNSADSDIREGIADRGKAFSVKKDGEDTSLSGVISLTSPVMMITNVIYIIRFDCGFLYR